MFYFAVMGIKYNMAIGLNKGHRTIPLKAGRKNRPTRRRGVSAEMYTFKVLNPAAVHRDKLFPNLMT